MAFSVMDQQARPAQVDSRISSAFGRIVAIPVGSTLTALNYLLHDSVGNLVRILAGLPLGWLLLKFGALLFRHFGAVSGGSSLSPLRRSRRCTTLPFSSKH